MTTTQTGSLTTLSNPLLLERLSKLVRTERKITHLVLECIAEIDSRELHLEMAYPSLFEYLVQAHGYSAGAAQRRISAARLLRELPEISEKIESGKLTLSQVSLLTQNIKLAEKKFNTQMGPGDKLELIEKIESRSFLQTQSFLAKELQVGAPIQERVRAHADGSVTIIMTLTAEQYRDWGRASELASHSLPNRNHAELAHYLARKEISRRCEIKRGSAMENSAADKSSSSLNRQVRSLNPRQIRPNLRKRILGSGGCVYSDPGTGKVCGSRHLLQVDHIKPVALGGGNEPGNLRALCARHNRFRSRGWGREREETR